MTRRPSRKSRPSSKPKPVYQLTIKGDTPEKARLMGREIKGSNKFTNINRQTRFLTSTDSKEKAVRIQQEQKQKGNDVIITRID